MAGSVSAQNISTLSAEAGGGNNKTTPSATIVYADPSSLENTLMTQVEKHIVFTQLPPAKSLMVRVTDANGNQVISKKISDKKNVVDISRLRKGMHFVTLISEQTNKKKSFTLPIE